MTRRRAAAALGTVLLLSGCGATEPSPVANTHATAQSLAMAVLQGFERRDSAALKALALTEAEFRDHVWPALPASRPERNLPFSYVWGDLRQKSESRLTESLARYGGRSLALTRVDFGGESSRYAGFAVHRNTVLTVREREGVEHRVRLFGSTLETGGRFKVFSYVVDE